MCGFILFITVSRGSGVNVDKDPVEDGNLHTVENLRVDFSDPPESKGFHLFSFAQPSILIEPNEGPNKYGLEDGFEGPDKGGRGVDEIVNKRKILQRELVRIRNQ